MCFRDAGLHATDLIYLELASTPELFVIPAAAPGANELFTRLHARGLFPQPVFGEAIRSTGGGLYCWPPEGDRR